MCLFLKMKSKLGWNNWIYKWGFKLPVVTVPVMTNVKYGYLYNWYAVTDVRNIANIGWHVATQAEYNTLITYLGGGTVAGAKLRETGLTYWDTPNTGATNEVNFNARGSGCRLNDGNFLEFKQCFEVWTGTAYNASYNYFAYTMYDMTNAYFEYDDPIVGMPVRVVKDSTSLTHGQIGTYTGNDGKVYRTICIGTQEWLADNLAETKYRNGDTIPTVTDNSAWYALTSGAKCAYNNDESNVLN